MVDANQVWEVQEAIDWMKELAQFKPLWIEEPTSPDDVLGHAEIARALKPLGIAVATGEMCCNRVLFKQFMQAEALEYCQIDSARIGGINEILSVYLMAKKLGGKCCALTQPASLNRVLWFGSKSMSTCWRRWSLRNGATFANVGLCGPFRNQRRSCGGIRGPATRTLCEPLRDQERPLHSPFCESRSGLLVVNGDFTGCFRLLGTAPPWNPNPSPLTSTPMDRSGSLCLQRVCSPTPSRLLLSGRPRRRSLLLLVVLLQGLLFKCKWRQTGCLPVKFEFVLRVLIQVSHKGLLMDKWTTKCPRTWRLSTIFNTHFESPD